MTFQAEYDVVVSGGGLAGVSAALAAAESGMKTVLIEKTALWGGLATSGLIYIYLPICDGMGHQVSAGLAERLFQASTLYGPGSEDPAWQTPNPDGHPAHPRCRKPFVPAAFIMAMDEMLESAGVEMYLDTVITGVEQTGNKVTAVKVFNKGGNGIFKGKVFVDATGDAEIVRQAGGRYAVDNNTLTAWALALADDGKDLPNCRNLTAHLRGMMKGIIDEAHPRQALTPRSDSDFILDSRRWMREYFQQLPDKNQGYPIVLPTQAQFRRSARIISRCGVAEDTHNTRFEDSIGMAADWCNVGIVQEIPYSAMLPETVENVIAAGRCIDGSGYGWELVRSIPAVAVSGEAAGTAAALCVKQKCLPHQLAVKELQTELRARGALVDFHSAGLLYRDEPGYQATEWLHCNH